MLAGAKFVAAFDQSAAAIAAARARCGRTNVRFEVGGALALPLPERFADVYICLETIEHLHDARALLAEAERIIKPDGLFICSTPNRTVTNPATSLTQPPWNSFHVREYTQAEFVELLGGAFRRIALYGQNPCHALTVRFLEGIAHFLPGHSAARLRQLSKLPQFVFDRAEHHAITPLNVRRPCEYIVAVCRQPLNAVGTSPYPA
jgi:SAM-dependent methyltransferase